MKKTLLITSLCAAFNAQALVPVGPITTTTMEFEVTSNIDLNFSCKSEGDYSQWNPGLKLGSCHAVNTSELPVYISIWGEPYDRNIAGSTLVTMNGDPSQKFKARASPSLDTDMTWNAEQNRFISGNVKQKNESSVLSIYAEDRLTQIGKYSIKMYAQAMIQ